jgi:hypothetical protein
VLCCRSPGEPVTVLDRAGFPRLLATGDGESLLMIGAGASPEGDRPFVDRLDLSTKATTRLFRSEAPFYEAPQAILDNEGKRLLTTRESPDAPPNYYVRDVGSKSAPRALTKFPHPTPQLRGVKKEQIRYTRKDGVELTGTLYLPPKYDPKRDGALPLLMWAYPAEFKSASAASQVTDSPYRFNAIGYWGPHPFLARGFAVLDDPSMPIVGEGDAEPNGAWIWEVAASLTTSTTPAANGCARWSRRIMALSSTNASRSAALKSFAAATLQESPSNAKPYTSWTIASASRSSIHAPEGKKPVCPRN